MRLSELSERSGVPLPIIKAYIREGLLQAGRASGKSRADYSEGHLAQLALIHASATHGAARRPTRAQKRADADGARSLAPRPSSPALTPEQARTAEIYRVVAAIPRGKVLTYGQIAELAGIRAGHRLVARAMRSCPEGLPWQRVTGKKDARRASVAIQDPEHAALQRRLLEREGVRFDRSGFIPLREHGWLPDDAPRAARTRR